MRTHRDIVRQAATAETLAALCAVSIHTVRSWAARDSIPAEHWLAIVEAGHCDADELIKAAADRNAA